MLVSEWFANLTAISVLNTEIQPPPKSVAAISDNAITSAILFPERMVVKIIKIRKGLPVPLGASMKYNLPI